MTWKCNACGGAYANATAAAQHSCPTPSGPRVQFQPPTDVQARLGIVTVRVPPYVGITSVPRRRYSDPRHGLPTWMVLGPLIDGQTLRATVSHGGVRLVDGVWQLELEQGDVPEALLPALLEAVRSKCPPTTPAPP